MSVPLLYKPEDAAAILGIGRSKLFELLAAGQLPSVQIGRARRIPASALSDFVGRIVAEQTRPPAA
ncbi:MAG: helix-turn-helix domain-containing protein [Actinomycetota bacterium]|nr:helix-turn-helix domain-containing protein [Actinomycetota bacterium]